MNGHSKRFIESYKCNSYGNYNLLQIMIREEKIEAIVEFASVSYLPQHGK